MDSLQRKVAGEWERWEDALERKVAGEKGRWVDALQRNGAGEWGKGRCRMKDAAWLKNR